MVKRFGGLKMNKIADKTSTSKNVIVPRWLYENILTDSKLIAWLTRCRGIGWINEVKKEMELDEKYNINNKDKY
jgi:hypothetical protein